MDLEKSLATESPDETFGDDDSGAITVDLGNGAVTVTRRMQEIPFVDLGADHRALQSELDAAIRDVIDRGDFILGMSVDRFEAAFASYSETDYAIGVDSGFSALEMMLRAYDIGDGAEVITAANTFVATVAAIEAAGARPVLVDVDPVSYNIDVAKIESAVTASTRAILPVHLYGQPAAMDPIRQIADQHGLVVLEDAAQAHGARYKGRRAGSLGDAAAFSFYPSKNLGAFGDGGMVTTSDPVIAERLRLLRNLGSAKKYHHETRGFNRRLDTLHAAILDVKLNKLDQANAARRRAAELYRQLLPGHVVAPTEAAEAEHVYHLFVVRASDRAQAMDYLASCGISTGIHYPVPIHMQPAYRDLGYTTGDFPVTEQLASEILSLPMYPAIPVVAIAQVAEAFTAVTWR